MQFVDDIGMIVINRGPESCKWRSEFCTKNCYNKKLYRAFGHVMTPKDVENEEIWKNYIGETLNIKLKKSKYNKRVRLCSRGEAFSEPSDIGKVYDILNKNPDTLIWIPTRAWRGPLREFVKELSMIQNARVMASIDPSNTKDEIDKLISEGWSTLFFGDDTDISNRFLCPKTWNKIKGECYRCGAGGCFSDIRVDVHLKKH